MSCTLTSRERLLKTLNHEQPDRVCVDFGATAVTGMSVVAISRLRKALLDDNSPVKVTEPYQMLGEVDDRLCEAIGVDVQGVGGTATLFGFPNKDWKPFTMFNGTEVLVPGNFNLTPTENGGWYIYPEGDTSVLPSGHMPKDGFYFDSICRQEPIDDDTLDPMDNVDYGPLPQSEIDFMVARAKEVAAKNRGAALTVPGTAFGDIALVPAPWKKETKGIREIEEWYVSTALRRDYVHQVFEKQCEIAIENLKKLTTALGDDIQAAFTTGTDFGTQNGLFISKDAYRGLYKPFHKTINDFIHANSNWKTFIHSCGSVIELIPDFIEAGFDILNPVQCSAKHMDPRTLKKEFGKDIVFWGGGVNTQQTLPFGTPDEVYNEVRERIEIFNEGGGFVFDAIHNVQSQTPIDNLVAMVRAIQDSDQ